MISSFHSFSDKATLALSGLQAPSATFGEPSLLQTYTVASQKELADHVTSAEAVSGEMMGFADGLRVDGIVTHPEDLAEIGHDKSARCAAHCFILAHADALVVLAAVRLNHRLQNYVGEQTLKLSDIIRNELDVSEPGFSVIKSQALSIFQSVFDQCDIIGTVRKLVAGSRLALQQALSSRSESIVLNLLVARPEMSDAWNVSKVSLARWRTRGPLCQSPSTHCHPLKMVGCA